MRAPGGIGKLVPRDFILERVAGQSYSGNLDSPYVGVSFKGRATVTTNVGRWAEIEQLATLTSEIA